jgi:hypothetical protein
VCRRKRVERFSVVMDPCAGVVCDWRALFQYIYFFNLNSKSNVYVVLCRIRPNFQ